MGRIIHGTQEQLNKKGRDQRDLFPISQQIDGIKPVEVIKIVEKPIEIIKLVEVVKPVEIVKYIDVIKEIEKPVVIEKIVEVIKEVEVPVVVREYEKVEIPVEVIVEKIVTVHNVEQLLEEKKRNESLERKLKIHRIAIAALILTTIIMAAI